MKNQMIKYLTKELVHSITDRDRLLEYSMYADEYKPTLLYNDLFKQNHKETFKKAYELGQRGVLNLKRYEEALDQREEALKVIHVIKDIEEIIQRTKGPQVQEMKTEVLGGLMGHNSTPGLVSAICLGKRNKDDEGKYYAINYKEIENFVEGLYGEKVKKQTH